MKVSLVIGAGATLSDVMNRSKSKRPPLDKGFFMNCRKDHSDEIILIDDYIKSHYGISILNNEFDSLEGVMTKLYADIYDPMLQKTAIGNFRNLIKIFNNRIAETTNNINITNQRYLYSIISRFLKDGVRPKNIKIITFNQDIQIEKTLEKLDETMSYKKFGKIFNFPYCYELDIERKNITSPTERTLEKFQVGNESGPKGIRILKLHGSLNWYSTHRSANFRPGALFNPNRPIRITTRKNINPNLSLVGRKKQYTFPIVVPPVTNKSSILHNKIRPIWNNAERYLKESDMLIIFGYSCPPTDFESLNLLQRSIRGRKLKKTYNNKS